MNNQHHTGNFIRSAKQACLAGQRLCGRMMNCALMVFILSVGFSAPALSDNAKRTRAQAVEIAKSRSGDGRVLSVKKRINKNGESVFAVKIIVNGRVKIYAIPEFAN